MNPRISTAVVSRPSEDLLTSALTLAASAEATDESWLSTFGWAKNSPDYDDAIKRGEQWRQDMNRKSLEEIDRHDGHS